MDINSSKKKQIKCDIVIYETKELHFQLIQHLENFSFNVVGMVGFYLILGKLWLKQHNFWINWKSN